MMEELKNGNHKLQMMNVALEENLVTKLTNLKDDFESKTKEIMHQIEDLSKKMEEIAEEDDEYYDQEESD